MAEVRPWDTMLDEPTPPAVQARPWDTMLDDDLETTGNFPETADGPKGEEVYNLPPPRPNMFANMADEDAAALYSAYENHPNTEFVEDGSGGVTLTHAGVPVPPPEGNTRGITPYLDSATGLPGGIYNGVRNAVLIGDNVTTRLAEGLGAASDYILPESMERTEEEKAASQAESNENHRWLEDAIPAFNSKGAVQGAGEVLGEIGTGIVAGNKVLAGAKVVGVGKKALGYLADKALKTFASGVGTMATVDGKSDTLITGDTAWMPLIKGLDGKSESEAQAALEGRINVLIDTFAVGAPVEMLADGGKLAAQWVDQRWLRPIKKGMFDSTKEIAIMENFMLNIANAADSKNPGSAKARYYQQKALDIISDPKNHKIFFGSNKMGINDVEESLDTATVIARGFEDDLSPEADAIRKLFAEKRKAVLERGGDHKQTDKITSRLETAPERYLNEATEAYGGKEGIEEAAADIRSSGRQEVGVVEAEADNTQFDLERTQEVFPQIVADNPTIGPELVDAAGQPMSVGKQGRNKVVGDIRDALATGKGVMKKEKDRLWKNIPEGLPVDEESLGLAITSATPHLTTDIKKAFKDSGVTISKAGDVTGGDFAKLQQNLRKPLKNAIESYTSRGNPVPEALYALRDNITKTQPDFLAGSARDQLDEIDPEDVDQVTSMLDEGRQTVKDAVDYTRDVYVPNVKDAVSLRIEQINMNPKLGRSQKLDEIGRAVEEVVTKEEPNEGIQFMKTLALDEFGNNDKLVPEYIKQSIADKLRIKVKGKGLKSLRAEDISKAFEPYQQILNSNPEHFSDYLSQLDKLQDDLIKNANNEEALTGLLKTKTADLSAIKTKIYAQDLNDFLTSEGYSKPSGTRSFIDLFSDVQTTGSKERGKLDGVIARAKASPNQNVFEGMKAAWLQHVKDLSFTPAPNASSGKSIRTAKVSEIVGEENNVLEIGRKLFDDLPTGMTGVPEVVVGLLNPGLDLTLAKKGGAFKGASAQSTRNDAQKAVNRIVMASMGPLTRGGARISVASGLILDALDPNDGAARIADAIMADPKEFGRIYDKFYKYSTKSSENFRNLFNFLTKAGIYNESDRNKWMEQALAINTDEQMGAMFETVNEAQEEKRQTPRP